MATSPNSTRRTTSRDLKRMYILRGEAKSPKHSAFMAAIKRRQTRGLKKRRLVAQLKPTPASTIVATRVFDMVELMEKILLHLSPGEIVRSRRVAKQWDNVYRGSVKLQRTLLLYTMPTRAREIVVWNPKGNVLPITSFIPTISTDTTFVLRSWGPSSSNIASLHPTKAITLKTEPGTPTLQALSVDIDTLLKWDVNGSWRTHQLTQPATKALHIIIPGIGACTIEYRSGITLGHLRNHLARIKNKHDLRDWSIATIVLVGVFTENYELVRLARENTQRPQDQKSPILSENHPDRALSQFMQLWLVGGNRDGVVAEYSL